MQSVADRVLEALKEVGLDRKNASKRAGLNETYIRDIVKGTSKVPSLSSMRQLAPILNRTAEELLYGPDSPEARAAKLLAVHERMDATQQRHLLLFAETVLRTADAEKQASGPIESVGSVPARSVEQPDETANRRRRVKS